MKTDVTVFYIEMTDPKALRPKRIQRDDLEIRQAKRPLPEFNRFLFTAVGAEYHWRSRLDWTHDRWMAYLSKPGTETWVAYLSGTPAGYFELETQPGGNVEIVHFGLLPPFIGEGLGGHLLTFAIERAWQMGARRVWLHTCTLDHPNALKNYCARGFRIYDQKTEPRDLPDQPLGPWPGANRPCRNT